MCAGTHQPVTQKHHGRREAIELAHTQTEWHTQTIASTSSCLLHPPNPAVDSTAVLEGYLNRSTILGLAAPSVK
jgi:hypothetical protein